jgi:hypothetical protein
MIFNKAARIQDLMEYRIASVWAAQTEVALLPFLVEGNPEADARQDGEAVASIAYGEFHHGNFLLSWFLVGRMKGQPAQGMQAGITGHPSHGQLKSASGAEQARSRREQDLHVLTLEGYLTSGPVHIGSVSYVRRRPFLCWQCKQTKAAVWLLSSSANNRAKFLPSSLSHGPKR